MNRITSITSRSRLAALFAIVVAVIATACKGGGSSGY
jgi:hypothetical protein